MKTVILATLFNAFTVPFLIAAPGTMSVSSDGTIMSGGPTVQQAEAAVQARISEQSGGNIKLATFKLLKTRFSDVELDNQTLVAADFEAVVTIQKKCLWAFRYHNQPLQFKTADENNGNTGLSEIIDVSTAPVDYTVRGAVWFRAEPTRWTPAGFSAAARPEVTQQADYAACVKNLKMIGLAFVIWADEHNNKLPFNCPADQGGTMALCSRDAQGLEKDAAIHFRVMATELGSPKILICPADTAKKAAFNFQTLAADNVSYKLHTGSAVNEENRSAVIVHCPIHDCVLLVDGTVKKNHSQ